MVHYTTIKETEKTNGEKFFKVKIESVHYTEDHFNEYQDRNYWSNQDHFQVNYCWYNGKRHQTDIMDFPTMEATEKFYQKKIQDCEEKIK